MFRLAIENFMININIKFIISFPSYSFFFGPPLPWKSKNSDTAKISTQQAFKTIFKEFFHQFLDKTLNPKVSTYYSERAGPFYMMNKKDFLADHFFKTGITFIQIICIQNVLYARPYL